MSNWRSYEIERFGGLRLDLEPDEVAANEAIDLLNVDLDKRGSVRTRDGYAKYNATPAGTLLGRLFAWQGQFIASGTTNIYAYINGALQTSSATSAMVTSAASLGTASVGPYLYLACSAGQAAQRYTGTVLSTMGATFPKATYLVAQPNENRLIAANIGTLPTGSTAAAADSSLVHVSDPGAPETWPASNWLYLHPHDGEAINGAATWGGFTFLFKESKFYVFYGNSTDSSGNPVFNYRTVDVGVGANPTQQECACAARDGVYFAGRDGVFRTTGGVPVKVSGALDGLFAGTTSPFFTAGTYVGALTGQIAASGDRVFVSVAAFTAGGGSDYYTLVYDISAESWAVWKFIDAITTPAFAQRASGVGLKPLLVLGTGHIYQMGEASTSDDGTAIASRYRSGFYTPSGNPAQECTVVESIIDGIGTPTFSVSRDFATSLPTTGGGRKATVTLGTSPAIAQGRHIMDQRGRRFSYQIEATSGAWRVESITQNLTGFREAGLKAA